MRGAELLRRAAEIDREYLKEVQQMDFFAARIAEEKGDNAAVEYVEYSVGTT